MRDVAKKRELSDNGLRKHFVKAFVNLPPQGHWNKLKAGHKVKITPLPPGISDTISIGNWDRPLARPFRNRRSDRVSRFLWPDETMVGDVIGAMAGRLREAMFAELPKPSVRPPARIPTRAACVNSHHPMFTSSPAAAGGYRDGVG